MAHATLHTTIDQHQGEHDATGLSIYQLFDVVTRFEDYFLGVDPDEDPDLDEHLAMLGEIHEARVALASLDDDRRRRAEDALMDEDCNPDNVADVIWRVIDETAAGDDD